MPTTASFPSPADGLAIATYKWDDVTGGPVGVVQLVHGLAEHGPRSNDTERRAMMRGRMSSLAPDTQQQMQELDRRCP